MPRIYKNHNAGYPTYMVPYCSSSSNRSNTYKCIVIWFFEGKWRLRLGECYASDFKHTGRDPFPCVGKINLAKILTDAILERITTEESSATEKENG